MSCDCDQGRGLCSEMRAELARAASHLRLQITPSLASLPCSYQAPLPSSLPHHPHPHNRPSNIQSAALTNNSDKERQCDARDSRNSEIKTAVSTAPFLEHAVAYAMVGF